MHAALWGPSFVMAASIGPFAPATLCSIAISAAGSLLLLGWIRGSADRTASLESQLAESSQVRLRLGQSVRELKGAIDASDAPLLVADASGRVTVASISCAAFFDKPADQLVGRSIDQLFTHAQALAARDQAQQGRPASAELRLRDAEGRLRTWLVRATPIAGGGLLMSLRDITEEAAASRLRTDFIAAASHELRTPLASIRAAVDTLADGAWEEAPMRSRLTRITLSNVTRLESLLRDLMELSRLGAGPSSLAATTIDAPAFINALVDDFSPLAKARGVSLVASSQAVPALITDPRLLDHILRNLIDNATKFSREGGTVRVECDASPTMLRIRVVDQGVGIPLAQQQHIFERFYQTDAARTGAAPNDPTARRGTGLGLAIARESAIALGGTIRVQSVWQQGTTMTVELPLQPPDLTRPATDSSPLSASSTNPDAAADERSEA